MSDAQRMAYYSTWHFTAVHMCLVNPQLQNRRAIAEFLKLPQETVSRTVDALLEMGLAEQKGHHIVGNYDRLHLPSDSPLVHKHHANWRMRAIHALDLQRSQDLHYSLVMSVSHEAAEKIRALLLNAIQSLEPVMKEAKDEAVYAVAVDLFDVRGG